MINKFFKLLYSGMEVEVKNWRRKKEVANMLSKNETLRLFNKLEETNVDLVGVIYDEIVKGPTFDFRNGPSIFSNLEVQEVAKRLGDKWNMDIENFIRNNSIPTSKDHIKQKKHGIIGIVLSDLVDRHSIVFDVIKVETKNSGYCIYTLADIHASTHAV